MVVVSTEEQKKRQRIPKRVTLINTCIFLVWLAITGIVISGFGQDLVGALLWVDLINLILNGIRNPIIAAFAFNANNQIRRETIDDRRKSEMLSPYARKPREKCHKRLEERGFYFHFQRLLKCYQLLIFVVTQDEAKIALNQSMKTCL